MEHAPSRGREGRSRVRWVVPLLLGLAMGALVLLASLQGRAGGAQALPAPSQYAPTGGSSAPSASSNPILVAGVILAALIVVFALLLAYRLRGTGGVPPDGEEEAPESYAGPAPTGPSAPPRPAPGSGEVSPSYIPRDEPADGPGS